MTRSCISPSGPPERATPWNSGPILAPAALSTPPGVDPDSSPVTAVFTNGTARCMNAR